MKASKEVSVEEIMGSLIDTAIGSAAVAETLGTLGDKAKLSDVINMVNKIIASLPKHQGRDRGPDSTREMTEDDARRTMLGDMKDMNHKNAAKELGLSYGQIYSARKGFTFKPVYQEWRKAGGK